MKTTLLLKILNYINYEDFMYTTASEEQLRFLQDTLDKFPIINEYINRNIIVGCRIELQEFGFEFDRIVFYFQDYCYKKTIKTMLPIYWHDIGFLFTNLYCFHDTNGGDLLWREKGIRSVLKESGVVFY